MFIFTILVSCSKSNDIILNIPYATLQNVPEASQLVGSLQPWSGALQCDLPSCSSFLKAMIFCSHCSDTVTTICCRQISAVNIFNNCHNTSFFLCHTISISECTCLQNMYMLFTHINEL